MQNAFIESAISRLRVRDNCLNGQVSVSIDDVRPKMA